MVSSYVTHWYRVLSRISAELISRRSPSQAFFSPLLVLLYTSTQDPTCALSSFNHHECRTELQGDGSLQVQPHVRTVTFLQLSVNSSLENTPETLTCGQRRCAHGQFVFLDGRVSYAARAVCDQLLPELLLALARLVCCPRDTAGSPHGLRYVFFSLPFYPPPPTRIHPPRRARTPSSRTPAFSYRQGRGCKQRATRARHRAQRRARIPPTRALAQIHDLAREGLRRELPRLFRRSLCAVRELRRDLDVRGLWVQRVPPRKGVLHQSGAWAQPKGRGRWFWCVSIRLATMSVQVSSVLRIVLADMRKPLSRDPMRRSVRANGRDIVVSANEVS